MKLLRFAPAKTRAEIQADHVMLVRLGLGVKVQPRSSRLFPPPPRLNLPPQPLSPCTGPVCSQVDTYMLYAMFMTFRSQHKGLKPSLRVCVLGLHCQGINYILLALSTLSQAANWYEVALEFCVLLHLFPFLKKFNFLWILINWLYFNSLTSFSTLIGNCVGSLFPKLWQFCF